MFVFRITSYIPSDQLEECEGKKSFRFKMPYTIKRRKKPCHFRRAPFPSVLSAHPLAPHRPVFLTL